MIYGADAMQAKQNSGFIKVSKCAVCSKVPMQTLSGYSKRKDAATWLSSTAYASIASALTACRRRREWARSGPQCSIGQRFWIRKSGNVRKGAIVGFGSNRARRPATEGVQ